MTLLYEAVVGSRCYGTNVPGSDTDRLFVHLDPPETVLAIGSEVGERGHQVHGDDDRSSFSLRRFAGQIVKGNPNLVSALCAPEFSGPQADALRSLLPTIHCFSTIERFVGMTLGQIRKFRSGALHDSRAHLVERYGYDTKFLYHVMRLETEAAQFMDTGRVEYPLDIAPLLVLVRSGYYTLGQANEILASAEGGLKSLQEAAGRDLPPGPDVDRANEIVLGIYEESWGIPGGTFTGPAKVSPNTNSLQEGS